MYAHIEVYHRGREIRVSVPFAQFRLWVDTEGGAKPGDLDSALTKAVELCRNYGAAAEEIHIHHHEQGAKS